jgi:hypothetical protein
MDDEDESILKTCLGSRNFGVNLFWREEVTTDDENLSRDVTVED